MYTIMQVLHKPLYFGYFIYSFILRAFSPMQPSIFKFSISKRIEIRVLIIIYVKSEICHYYI